MIRTLLGRTMTYVAGRAVDMLSIDSRMIGLVCQTLDAFPNGIPHSRSRDRTIVPFPSVT